MRPIDNATPPGPRRLIRVLTQGLTLLGAAALALVLAGQFGRVSAAADALNHLAPVWLSLAIFCSLARLLLPGPRRGAALVFAASVPLAIHLLGPAYFPGPGPHRPCGAQTTTIVDFNVWKENRDPERAAAWIRAQKPDVVVLQEAAERGDAVRAALSREFPHQVDCLASNRRCSTLILSKTPPEASGGLADGDAENRKALSGVWAAYATDRGRMTVVGLHLDRPWPFGVVRPSRLRTLADFVRTTDPAANIVVGDFNQTPWTFALKHIDRIIGTPRATRGLATWPTLEGMSQLPLPPVLAIDQAYVGERLGLCSLERGPSLGSDHYPLLVKVELVLRP